MKTNPEKPLWDISLNRGDMNYEILAKPTPELVNGIMERSAELSRQLIEKEEMMFLSTMPMNALLLLRQRIENEIERRNDIYGIRPASTNDLPKQNNERGNNSDEAIPLAVQPEVS